LSENAPKVKGISLRCGDCTKHWDDGNPFEATVNKKKGCFYISLAEMNGFLPSDENIKQSAFPELGITFSSLTHKKLLTAPNIVAPKYKRSTINEAKFKKEFFFGYKLAKGTNLEPFQMAVVLDNTSELHCSLIIREDIEGEIWQEIGPGSKILWPPGEDIPDQKEDKIVAWKKFVNNQLSPRKAMQLYNYDDIYEIYPAVAAHFELHDFTILASAEPIPPESGDKEKDPLYLASFVLYKTGYEYDNQEELILSLDQLENNGYDATKLNSYNLGVLLKAMSRALDEDLDFLDFYGSDIKPVNILEDAISLMNQICVDKRNGRDEI
jgi:hypothetical protein